MAKASRSRSNPNLRPSSSRPKISGSPWFWEIRDPGEAIAYLKRGHNWATLSRLDSIIRAARTIRRCWRGIINYLKTLVTNGTAEGLKLKIKTAMKRS
jgi:transposase